MYIVTNEILNKHYMKPIRPSECSAPLLFNQAYNRCLYNLIILVFCFVETAYTIFSEDFRYSVTFHSALVLNAGWIRWISTFTSEELGESLWGYIIDWQTYWRLQFCLTKATISGLSWWKHVLHLFRINTYHKQESRIERKNIRSCFPATYGLPGNEQKTQHRCTAGGKLTRFFPDVHQLSIYYHFHVH